MTNMNRVVKVLVAILPLMLSGCSERKQDPALSQQIQQLSAQVEKQEQQYGNELNEIRTQLASAEQKIGEYENQTAQLRQQIESKNAEIISLTQTVDRARAYIQQTKQRQTIVAHAPAANGASDFIHPPVGVNPDLFPVYVFNIGGKKVQTGQHTEWQPKKSDVTVNRVDQYGNVWNQHSIGGGSEPVTVKDYGRQVLFSVRNLTKTVKNFSVDGGLGARDFSIQAGGVLENLSVDAADGSPLTITVSGITKQFQVPR